MGLNAKNVESSRNTTPPLDPGSYPGRLVQVVDMGLQPREFRGEVKEPARQVSLTYELVDEFLLDEDGQEMLDKPRWVSESFNLFNLDSERAKSTQRYYTLDPDENHGGDFAALVATPVMVTVVQNKQGEKVYTNVGGVAPMREKDAEKCPELVNEPRVFDLDFPDMEVFAQLPQWIQEKIKTNLEFRGSQLEALLSGEVKENKEEAPCGPEGENKENPY